MLLHEVYYSALNFQIRQYFGTNLKLLNNWNVKHLPLAIFQLNRKAKSQTNRSTQLNYVLTLNG